MNAGISHTQADRASPTVRDFLNRNPELAEYIAQEQRHAPFPGGYTPSVIAILYEGMIFLRWERGRITYLKNCPRNYVPDLVEILFDEQTALLVVKCEILVDRTTYMASVDELLGRLGTKGDK